MALASRPSLEITAAVRGRSWGLLTLDTGSITRLDLVTNKEDFAWQLHSYWLAQTTLYSGWPSQKARAAIGCLDKAALEGKSSHRFLVSILATCPYQPTGWMCIKEWWCNLKVSIQNQLLSKYGGTRGCKRSSSEEGPCLPGKRMWLRL